MKRHLDDDEWSGLQQHRQELLDAIRDLKRASVDCYLDYGLDLEIELAHVEEQLKPDKADCKPFSLRAFDHHRCGLCQCCPGSSSFLTVSHRQLRMGPEVLEKCAAALLPETVRGNAGCSCDRLEAFCLLMFRMAFPVRWADVRIWFGGKSEAWLSNIFHATLNLLHAVAIRVLLSFSPALLDRVPAYVAAMEHVCQMPAWGALDGDHLNVCRPTLGQRAFYNGNGQGHTVRALGIYAPNGLCELLFGCVPGSASDLNMFNDADLERRLGIFHGLCKAKHNLHTFVLADGIFSTSNNVLTPYTKRTRDGAKVSLDVSQRVYGYFLSRARIGAEWGNKDVLTNFASLVYKPQQKVLHTDPEKSYPVAVLLCNLIKCAGRGTQQFESYYGVPPPTLDEYLAEIETRL